MPYRPGFFQIVYSIYALIWFVLFTLLVFPFVVICSLFGDLRGGNGICRACRLWADIWYFLIGLQHRNIYDAPYDKTRTYVFVSNHISYLDISCVFRALKKQPFRILGKSELNKVPIFGYIYKRGAVTVDRSSSRDRARSVRRLTRLLRQHVSVVIFPEGTFNETGAPLKSFYDGAFRIALETHTPVKPLLFLDNHSRMNYRSILSMTPGRSRVVFLDAVPTEGFTVKDIRRYKEKVHLAMAEGLKKYGAAWIRPDPREHQGSAVV